MKHLKFKDHLGNEIKYGDLLVVTSRVHSRSSAMFQFGIVVHETPQMLVVLPMIGLRHVINTQQSIEYKDYQEDIDYAIQGYPRGIKIFGSESLVYRPSFIDKNSLHAIQKQMILVQQVKRKNSKVNPIEPIDIDSDEIEALIA